MLDKEYIWIVALVVGILWQVGGSGYKWVRRFGAPLVLGLAAFYYLGFKWQIITFMLSLHLITRLPFTLKGDGIKGLLNWLWIPVVSYLAGLPAMWIDLAVWKYAFVTLAVKGILSTLSNLKFSREAVQWKIVEGMMGIAVSYPLAMIITS